MRYLKWLSGNTPLPTFTLLLCLFATSGGFAAENGQKVIRLATTTSTENSGLLRYLLPIFQKTSGYRVDVIAVGTGNALRMGRDGDVDLILVHAPSSEKIFVQSGYGVKRYPVMYNDFILVGPTHNPAKLTSTEDTSQSMRRIAQSQALFISRGDDSGTHKKELSLWHAAGISPDHTWYREAGQGMGKVLQIAAELDGYTLADRGTWLAHAKNLPLKIVFEGDRKLHNPYSIIAINPKRHGHSNYAGATRLIEWITSAEGQKLIGDYRIDGTLLFTPSADPLQTIELRR